MAPSRTRDVEMADAPADGSKKTLFDDSDAASGDEDHEDGGAELQAPKLKINEEYAKRFEHNKKREEIQRLEEKFKTRASKGQGVGADEETESSDEESEDEDAFLATEELDAEISATLQAIKNKDPRIYDKDAKFYHSLEKLEEEGAQPEKKEKPVTLRDYHRERYMRGDVGADDDEDEAKPKTFIQEQADLKKSILSEINAAADDDESDVDDFIKKKDSDAKAANGIHPSRQKRVKQAELDVENANKDPETFLSNFMASRAWLPAEGEGWQPLEEDDDEEDNLADQFETAYNLRFEDPEKSNEVLRSYSRKVVEARSVRREELTGRKKQRELEKEKKEAEKRERQEERARLKKLKMEEAEGKLARIKKAAGMSGKVLKDEEWVRLLDEAWDDDKWEEEMRKRFDDQYYAEPDAELAGSDDEDEDAEDAGGKKKKKPKKPKWDDDIDIKDIIPDFEDKELPKVTLSDSDAEPAADEADEADSDEEGRPSKKRKTGTDHKKGRQAAQRAARAERSKIEALVDARMELDDPTALATSSKNPAGGGFRYRETSPTSYGLTARDILLAPSDAALNEFVGLKKLATFRPADKKRKDKKRLGKKARLRQWRRDVFGHEFEHTGPTFGFADDQPGGGGAGARRRADEVNAAIDRKAEELDGEKKKKKRKRSKGKKAGASE